MKPLMPLMGQTFAYGAMDSRDHKPNRQVGASTDRLWNWILSVARHIRGRNTDARGGWLDTVECVEGQMTTRSDCRKHVILDWPPTHAFGLARTRRNPIRRVWPLAWLERYNQRYRSVYRSVKLSDALTPTVSVRDDSENG